MVNKNVRSGRKTRKRASKALKTKNARYVCKKCQKKSVVNKSFGIWVCKSCGTKYAGGAYKYQTAPGKEADRKALQAVQ